MYIRPEGYTHRQTDRHMYIYRFETSVLDLATHDSRLLWEYFLEYILYLLIEYFQDKVHVTHTHTYPCTRYSIIGLVLAQPWQSLYTITMFTWFIAPATEQESTETFNKAYRQPKTNVLN